ncbi:hypothetical protein Y1Q_0015954 [Alligator mississippiensis]|uniref:Uncharacterized protein n=1 Tax=Alligator mississippiensis TaxID=8496 RepID=A0A151MV80_ALLMI|nr:hypothetical protein Y1Q_0015954 [Alligator mississippiensis]
MFNILYSLDGGSEAQTGYVAYQITQEGPHWLDRMALCKWLQPSKPQPSSHRQPGQKTVKVKELGVDYKDLIV